MSPPSLPAPLGWVDSNDDRGISPAVGVALMLVIVVALVAAFGALAFGFTDELAAPAPNGGFTADYVPSGENNDGNGPYVNVTHLAGPSVDGDDVVVRDGAGNEVAWEDVWTGGSTVEGGEYVHLDGVGSDGALRPICDEGDAYRIVVADDDGERLLYEWTAPSSPDAGAVSSEC